jgi:hypothetical protein
VNANFATQSGPFTLELDATATSSNADAVIGLSRGVARRYADLAAILRFNVDGALDARNGGSYGAPYPIPYAAGVNQHLRFDVDPTQGVYSVSRIRPSDTTVIGDGFAFRTEQAGATSLAHAALKVDESGALSVCNVRVGSPCASVVAGARFTNRAILPEDRAFTLSFSVTPSANDVDVAVGVTSGPASKFNDFAATVRFNPNGTIDDRNGSGYAAVEPISYSAGTSYEFLLVVDVLGHTYTAVDVTDSRVIAENYAFRSQQAGVAVLGNVAAIADAGTATVCDIAAARSERAAYVHPMAHYGSVPLTNLAGLGSGELLAASATDTTVIDARGDVSGSVPHGGALALDAAENRYFAGTFRGSYDGGGGPIASMGGTDVYLSKFDPSWQPVYSFAFGGAGDDQLYSYAVNGPGEVFLRVNDEGSRLDAQGNVLWTHSFMGSSYLALDDDGNAFFGQNSAEPRSFSVTKLDPSGTEAWTHTAVLTSGGATLREIKAGPDGAVVLQGSMNGWIDFGDGHVLAATPYDRSMKFVAKYAADGSFVFATFVDINSDTGMTLDGQGRITLGGTRYNPDRFFLEQFDADGTFLRELGGNELLNGLFLGSGQTPSADRAGNVYWTISPRLGGPSFSYFLKLSP